MCTKQHTNLHNNKVYRQVHMLRRKDNPTFKDNGQPLLPVSLITDKSREEVTRAEKNRNEPTRRSKTHFQAFFKI